MRLRVFTQISALTCALAASFSAYSAEPRTPTSNSPGRENISASPAEQDTGLQMQFDNAQVAERMKKLKAQGADACQNEVAAILATATNSLRNTLSCHEGFSGANPPGATEEERTDNYYFNLEQSLVKKKKSLEASLKIKIDATSSFAPNSDAALFRATLRSFVQSRAAVRQAILLQALCVNYKNYLGLNEAKLRASYSAGLKGVAAASSTKFAGQEQCRENLIAFEKPKAAQPEPARPKAQVPSPKDNFDETADESMRTKADVATQEEEEQKQGDTKLAGAKTGQAAGLAIGVEEIVKIESKDTGDTAGVSLKANESNKGGGRFSKVDKKLKDYVALIAKTCAEDPKCYREQFDELASQSHAFIAASSFNLSALSRERLVKACDGKGDAIDRVFCYRHTIGAMKKEIDDLIKSAAKDGEAALEVALKSNALAREIAYEGCWGETPAMKCRREAVQRFLNGSEAAFNQLNNAANRATLFSMVAARCQIEAKFPCIKEDQKAKYDERIAPIGAIAANEYQPLDYRPKYEKDTSLTLAAEQAGYQQKPSGGAKEVDGVKGDGKVTLATGCDPSEPGCARLEDCDAIANPHAKLECLARNEMRTQFLKKNDPAFKGAYTLNPLLVNPEKGCEPGAPGCRTLSLEDCSKFGKKADFEACQKRNAEHAAKEQGSNPEGHDVGGPSAGGAKHSAVDGTSGLGTHQGKGQASNGVGKSGKANVGVPDGWMLGRDKKLKVDKTKYTENHTPPKCEKQQKDQKAECELAQKAADPGVNVAAIAEETKQKLVDQSLKIELVRQHLSRLVESWVNLASHRGYADAKVLQHVCKLPDKKDGLKEFMGNDFKQVFSEVSQLNYAMNKDARPQTVKDVSGNTAAGQVRDQAVYRQALLNAVSVLGEIDNQIATLNQDFNFKPEEFAKHWPAWAPCRFVIENIDGMRTAFHLLSREPACPAIDDIAVWATERNRSAQGGLTKVCSQSAPTAADKKMTQWISQAIKEEEEKASSVAPQLDFQVAESEDGPAPMIWAPESATPVSEESPDGAPAILEAAKPPVYENKKIVMPGAEAYLKKSCDASGNCAFEPMCREDKCVMKRSYLDSRVAAKMELVPQFPELFEKRDKNGKPDPDGEPYYKQLAAQAEQERAKNLESVGMNMDHALKEIEDAIGGVCEHPESVANVLVTNKALRDKLVDCSTKIPADIPKGSTAYRIAKARVKRCENLQKFSPRLCEVAEDINSKFLVKTKDRGGLFGTNIGLTGKALGEADAIVEAGGSYLDIQGCVGLVQGIGVGVVRALGGASMKLAPNILANVAKKTGIALAKQTFSAHNIGMMSAMTAPQLAHSGILFGVGDVDRSKGACWAGLVSQEECEEIRKADNSASALLAHTAGDMLKGGIVFAGVEGLAHQGASHFADKTMQAKAKALENARVDLKRPMTMEQKAAADARLVKAEREFLDQAQYRAANSIGISNKAIEKFFEKPVKEKTESPDAFAKRMKEYDGRREQYYMDAYHEAMANTGETARAAMLNSETDAKVRTKAQKQKAREKLAKQWQDFEKLHDTQRRVETAEAEQIPEIIKEGLETLDHLEEQAAEMPKEDGKQFRKVAKELRDFAMKRVDLALQHLEVDPLRLKFMTEKQKLAMLTEKMKLASESKAKLANSNGPFERSVVNDPALGEAALKRYEANPLDRREEKLYSDLERKHTDYLEAADPKKAKPLTSQEQAKFEELRFRKQRTPLEKQDAARLGHLKSKLEKGEAMSVRERFELAELQTRADIQKLAQLERAGEHLPAAPLTALQRERFDRLEKRYWDPKGRLSKTEIRELEQLRLLNGEEQLVKQLAHQVPSQSLQSALGELAKSTQDSSALNRLAESASAPSRESAITAVPESNPRMQPSVGERPTLPSLPDNLAKTQQMSALTQEQVANQMKEPGAATTQTMPVAEQEHLAGQTRDVPEEAPTRKTMLPESRPEPQPHSESSDRRSSTPPASFDNRGPVSKAVDTIVNKVTEEAKTIARGAKTTFEQAKSLVRRSPASIENPNEMKRLTQEEIDGALKDLKETPQHMASAALAEAPSLPPEQVEQALRASSRASEDLFVERGKSFGAVDEPALREAYHENEEMEHTKRYAPGELQKLLEEKMTSCEK